MSRKCHQGARRDVFHDGILPDGQVQLVANQKEALGDGVGHQVDARSHDDGDDAEVQGRAGQRPGAAFNQLRNRGNTKPEEPL